MVVRSIEFAKRVGHAPWGLLGMLALVFAVEGYVAKHELQFTTIWVSAWPKSGEAATGKEVVGAEVLCLGDSLVKHGIVPKVLEARLGRSVYNLAVFNGQGPTSYFLLKRALAAGAKPSALIIDGEALEDDPRVHERRWMDLLEPREIFEFARETNDPRLFAALMLGRYLPSDRDRHEIRASIMAALRGKTESGRYIVPIHWRNWTQNRGAQVEPSEPSAARFNDQPALLDYLPTDWACHPINALYVDKLMTLAASRGTPVFWLIPPLHPAVHERRTRGGMHAKTVTYVRSVQARYPNLIVVDGRDANYDPSTLFDLTHLNGRGASAFTLQVGDVMSERLTQGVASGPLWVKLPPYQNSPIAPSLEDTQQSAIALKEMYAKRARK